MTSRKRKCTAAMLLLGIALAAPVFGPRDCRAADGESSQAQRRNLKNLGLSLLLPGLAHLSEGQKGRAVPFLAAEGTIWAGFAVFRVQGAARRNTYEEMARYAAGVRSPAEQSEDYYRLIGGWFSSDLYNENVVRPSARAAAGDDLAAREAWYEAHKIAADVAWEWESDAARIRYLDKRRESQAGYRHARTMVALAAANRMAAFLDLALFAPRKGSEERAFSIEAAPGPELSSARLFLRVALP